MTCSCPIDKLFMTFSLVHDLFINCLLLVHQLLLSHDFFTTCSSIIKFFFMIFPWNLFMTWSQFVHRLSMTYIHLWIFHNFFKSCLCLAHDLFKTITLKYFDWTITLKILHLNQFAHTTSLLIGPFNYFTWRLQLS